MKHLRIFSAACLALFCSASLCLAADEEKKKDTDPSGTWRWEYDSNGETVHSVLKLTYDNKKLTGTYKGQTGPHELKNAKREDDKVSFGFDIDYEGRTINIAFEGTVADDKVDGTVSMGVDGESREFPWQAKRTLKNEDVVGSWKLRIQTPDGNVLTPKIAFSLDKEKKALTGKYTTSNDDYDLDVSDVKVKDHQLHFTVAGDINGNSISAKYNVQPRGDKLAGKIEIDFNGQGGELETTGKREIKKKKEAETEE